ncbi:hypothetical protein AKO1_001917, partial [Acrasis kona]
LEPLIVKAIQKFLGDYVDLDTKSLLLALWSGKIQLKNVNIKNGAVNSLDLPVVITHARVGDLTVNIPWRNLKEEPVTAQLSDVYVVVQPRKSIIVDPLDEEKRLLEVKKSKLAGYEAAYAGAMNAKEEEDEEEVKFSSPDDTFVATLITAVVNNIQVHIKNIHIRYEDNSDLRNPIILGVMLKSLDIDTCDPEWSKKAFHSDASDQLARKSIELRGLSAYLSINNRKNFCHEIKPEHLPDKMRS